MTTLEYEYIIRVFRGCPDFKIKNVSILCFLEHFSFYAFIYSCSKLKGTAQIHKWTAFHRQLSRMFIESHCIYLSLSGCNVPSKCISLYIIYHGQMEIKLIMAIKNVHILEISEPVFKVSLTWLKSSLKKYQNARMEKLKLTG